MRGPLGQLIAAVDGPAGLAGVLLAISQAGPRVPVVWVLLEASLSATHEPTLGVVAVLLAEFRRVLATRGGQPVAGGRMRPAGPETTAMAGRSALCSIASWASSRRSLRLDNCRRRSKMRPVRPCMRPWWSVMC